MESTWFERLRRRMIRENRIYIIPSGRGMVFLGVIVVLILAAATYNNNLIFMLAFFMFSLFFVSMIQTHYNLKGVRLHFLSSEAGFAEEPLSLLFHLEQRKARYKFALRVRALSKGWSRADSGFEPGLESMAPSEMRKAIRCVLIAPKRGVHPLPQFALETYYPLGLFRAWKIFRPKGEITVFPKPRGVRILPPTNFEYGEHDLGLRNSPEGDFGELKNYQPGESYHQIAWKHFARTGHLYTKVHWGEEHKHFHLPWDPHGATFETYLEQMSAWIKTAVEENATFEMELPRFKIEPGQGPDHADACWKALAAMKESA